MLEEALVEFNGTIITVSHDRYFLDKVVDKLLVIGIDELGKRKVGCHKFTVSKAAYSLYAQQIRENVIQAQAEKNARSSAPKKRRGKSASGSKQTTPEELRPFNRYTVEQIEAMIMDTEQQIDELREGFGDEAIYQQPDRLTQHQNTFEEKQARLDLLYRAYEHRAG
jgi:ATP-binding cassette subfamily F protein 3